MFTLFIIISAVFLIGSIILAVYACYSHDGFPFGIGSVVAFVGGVLLLTAPLTVWEGHANDLGTIDAQHEVIAVYQQRIQRLTERLEAFNYRSEDAEILLNADSPVAAVVASLTEAEDQLAQAEAQRAVAIRSIEQRRRGPWQGIIDYTGDYQ